MRAALTVWEGRIAPVFDVSREAVLVTIEAGQVTERRSESIEAPTAEAKIARLQTLGVETLICGAISGGLQQELHARGVRVLGFVAGTLEEVLAALLAGGLPGPALAMPGCCGRQHRGRRQPGCARGRGRAAGRGSERSPERDRDRQPR